VIMNETKIFWVCSDVSEEDSAFIFKVNLLRMDAAVCETRKSVKYMERFPEFWPISRS
jgi:hypothetical protein